MRRFLVACSVFFCTALIGVWAAYDRWVAWERLALIALGLVLALGVAQAGQQEGRRVLAAFGPLYALVSGVIGLVYLLGLDWSPYTAGRIVLAPPAIQSLLSLDWPSLHPDAAGGALAITIPPGIAGTFWAASRRSRWLLGLCVLTLAVALLGLLLTFSRGAWIGLLAGIACGGLSYWQAGWLQDRNARRLPWADLLLVAAGLVFFAGFWVLVGRPGADQAVAGIVPAGGSTLSRVYAWRQMLPLVMDYPLSGSGLGSTAMVLSSYSLLLHVPFLYHAHQLFLQIAVEQGIPGLVAFVVMVALAVRSVLYRTAATKGARVLRAGLLASLVALIVHGMIDSELYAGSLLPLVFVPLGAGIGMARRTQRQYQEGLRVAPAWRKPVYGLAALTLVLVAMTAPSGRAVLYANNGAVLQTRAELSIYRWPEQPMVDAVRRLPDVDLGPAIAQYRAALALDPANPVANRRLGQIEQSLGHYTEAQLHLEAAYRAGPDVTPAKALLAESYAAAGQVEEAAALWRQANYRQGQVDLRRWWYEYIGDRVREGYLKETMRLMTDGE